ncbi:ferritin-like domain-containing protein [Kaarinaea lacus]
MVLPVASFDRVLLIQTLQLAYMNKNLFQIAERCLLFADVSEKVSVTRRMAEQWREGTIDLEKGGAAREIPEAGRPEKPNLVHPRKLPSRSFAKPEGHAALIHSIAHIEFNAINLAWDAVYRFRDMPRQFYDDWVRVADEEAYHFQLIRDHLNTLGHDYGDFDAHNGLWEMAVKTAHDPLVRMALVPRVLEARGLDVTPGIMQRLKEHGDDSAVSILEIIFRDEIGHVEIGTHWFHYLCEKRNMEPDATFRGLLTEYMKGGSQVGKGSLHRKARLAAGFTDAELNYLEGIG